MEKAVIVWPEGNENLSGGKTFAQQCGSYWQGRGRWLRCFNPLKTKMPMTAALPAAPTAAIRCAQPKIISIIPSPYQIHPSPIFVAAIIQMRIQRGARQRFIRRINRWSRRSINPHSVRATAIASPHTNGRRNKRTLAEIDAQLSKRDFPRIPCTKEASDLAPGNSRLEALKIAASAVLAMVR